MQPEIYNITYYSGDTFTITIYPKDSTGESIDLSGVDKTYFRLADKRDDLTGWNVEGFSEITSLTYGGPACIKCDLSSENGRNIKNGYVYDIGYWIDNKRVTVLTGSFQVMSEVKTSGSS